MGAADPAGAADATDATEPPDGTDLVDSETGVALLPRRIPRPVPPPLPEATLIAVAMDPAAPEAASAARRHRRDRLLSGPPDTLPTEEEIIMDAAGQSAEFGEWAEATNVGSTTLEQLDDDVRRIARDYLSNAPLPLMLHTLRVRNRVFTLLEGRQHPAQTRQLYLTAGRLCGLLAWMAGDVGRHGEAETQARTGWLCAELADADGLRAWIRATQSKVAYWEGRVRESARLADDGLRFAAPDTARVLRPAWAPVPGPGSGTPTPPTPRSAGPGTSGPGRARTRSAACSASARPSRATSPAAPTCGCTSRPRRCVRPTGRSGCTTSATRPSGSTARRCSR